MKRNLALCLCLVFASSGLLACTDSKDDDKQPCKAADYPQCEGAKLLSCVDGFLQKQTCSGGCDDEKKVCKFAVLECSPVDYPKCDGSELLTCIEGAIVKETCTAGCDADTKACKAVACVAADYPKCDGDKLLTCVKDVVESQICSAGCDATAKVCKLEEIECEAADYPKCDGDNLLSCANGKVESQICSAGCDATAKVCKFEEIKCEAADYPKCDGTKIQTCVSGNVVSSSCDAGEVCNDDVEVKCVKTAKTCDATHVDSCNGNMRVLCESNVVVEKACKAKEICVDGACKADESSPLEQECEFGVFVENCYLDDMPLICPQKYKKIALHPDYPNGCKAKGLVCGTTTENEITLVDCFEPCTVLNEERAHCGDSAGTTYEWVDKCIKIGTDSKKNPVYGYEMLQGSFNTCEIGCDGSKCKVNDDLGKPCIEGSYQSRCEGKLSIYCNDDVVQATDCGALACVSGHDSIDICLEPCKAGDPVKKNCITFIGQPATVSYTCKEVGNPSSYYYVKGTDVSTCKNSCSAGVCE